MVGPALRTLVVMLHTALAAGASVVALAFSLSTFERWREKRQPYQLAWTVAFALFLAAAACLWWGAADRWTGPVFRLFYLFGAITNVPVLALGTVYLIGRQRQGDRAALVVVVFCAFSAGVIAAAPFTHVVPPRRLPQGSDVFGALPRVLAAVGSSAGALVVVAGAAWSALRDRRRAAANALIVAGTLVLGAGGVLNSTVGAMNAFSLSLLAGVVLIFVGFLAATSSPLSRPTAARVGAASPPAREGGSQRM
jgi:FtsH-binding integral membrane protein